MVFSDCGLVINPDADELASIAVMAAQSCKDLLQIEPSVAMLSFSTRKALVTPKSPKCQSHKNRQIKKS